jgi:hypothetical protein
MADALVAKGVLDRARADAALRDRERTGLGFGQLVVERGWVPDDVYADILALVYGVDRFRLDRARVDPSVVADVEEGWLRARGLMPLASVPGRREVLVATTDPENLHGIDALGFRLGRRLQLAAASRMELELLLRHVFQGEPLPGPSGAPGGPPLEERERLARAVSENKQAARALRAIFELCVARGVFTAEELERRMASETPFGGATR